MSYLLAAWKMMRAVPALVWAAAGGMALVSSLWLWHGRAVSAAYARGHTDTVNAARFDSALVKIARARVDSAQRHTDTVFVTVTKTARRVDSVATRVPDTVRVLFPVVDTLVVESRAFVRNLDSLASTLDTERAATRMALAVDSAAILNARLLNAAQRDTIHTLEKRPTRLRAFAYSLLSALIATATTYGATR